MKLRTKGILALAIALTELAITPIVLRINGISSSSALALSNTIAFLFYVFLIGSIASLIMCYYNDRMKGLKSIISSKEILILVVIAGLFNDAISQVLLGLGSIGTNPSVAAIVFRTWTIMVLILTPLILRNRVTKMQLFAMIIGTFGLYIIISNGTLLHFQSAELPYLGILLLAALSIAVANLVMKKYNMDTLGAITIFNIASFIFLGAIVLPLHYSYTFTFTSELSALFLGVIAYAMGTYFYYYALKILGTLYTGNAILVVPFFTIFLSFFLIGTPLEGYYFIAAALIGTGVLIQQRYNSAIQHLSSSDLKHWKIAVFDVTGAFAHSRNPNIQKFIKGKNKALAIKIKKSTLRTKAYEKIFSNNKCIFFTTEKIRPEIQDKQMEYIKDAMNIGPDEIGIIGLGDEVQIETAFNSILKSI